MGFQGWGGNLTLFLGFPEGLAGVEDWSGVRRERLCTCAWFFLIERGHLLWELDFIEEHGPGSAFQQFRAVWTRNPFFFPWASTALLQVTLLGEHSSLHFTSFSYLCLAFCKCSPCTSAHGRLASPPYLCSFFYGVLGQP